ncbi:MAG: SH3 domain-containing protein [Elusimicrobia bacterium]|nr:SH3 domain-containing protein [Elusimicrobiota bacterium]
MTGKISGVCLVVFLVLRAAPAGAQFVCVSAEQANIREGTDPEYPAAWIAYRHTPLKLLGWTGRWAKVKDFEGDVGWAHESVLSFDPCVILAGKYANVRAGPGLENEVLWVVERGYPLKVLNRLDDWLQVTDNDEVEGWIYVNLVWGNTNPWEPNVS